MIEGLPWQAWTGVLGGSVGLNILFVWMIFTGKAATGRELREKNKRIEWFQGALDNRDKQVALLLGESVPVTSSVLSALHAAVTKEGDPS